MNVKPLGCLILRILKRLLTYWQCLRFAKKVYRWNWIPPRNKITLSIHNPWCWRNTKALRCLGENLRKIIEEKWEKERKRPIKDATYKNVFDYPPLRRNFVNYNSGNNIGRNPYREVTTGHLKISCAKDGLIRNLIRNQHS